MVEVNEYRNPPAQATKPSATGPPFHDMNGAQRNAYFYLWGQAWQALVGAGMSATFVDQERHAIHVNALGYAKSSKDMTNSELSKVYKGPDPKRRLVEQANMKTTAIHHIEFLKLNLGLDPGLETSYVQGISRNVFRTLDYSNLGHAQLTKLEGIVLAAVKRKHSPARVAEIVNEMRAHAARVAAIVAGESVDTSF